MLAELIVMFAAVVGVLFAASRMEDWVSRPVSQPAPPRMGPRHCRR
jgi:hypothetical protein